MVDIHDFLYVCIGDGGCPERSSSIRTRATVVEVTGWRFTFLSKDPPNLSIRWETHRKRGGPARSSSMRTRAIMAEVTGWRFTFSSWDPPNFSIRWETHWKRVTSVSPTSTDAILLLFVSNSTRRHRHLHCLYYFKRRHRGTRTKF